MKVCKECGEEKPLSEYHKHAECVDGRQPRCKSCASKYNRERYIRTSAEVRARVAAYKEAHPDAVLASRLRVHAKKQTKRTAQRCVEAAILAGQMIKPHGCDECGEFHAEFGRFALHAHHDDYTDPLAVRWLCPKCHAAAHPEKWEKVACVVCNRLVSRSGMANHLHAHQRAVG